MKKIAVISTALTLCASLLAGCGQSSTKPKADAQNSATPAAVVRKPVTLDYWHPLTGGDAKFMDEIVQKFNSENKNGVTVKQNIMKADELSQKLAAANTASTGLPHILYVGSNDVYMQQRSKLLLPVDDLMDKVGLKKEESLKQLNDAVTFDKKMYGVPVEVHPWVMFYNKKLLNQIGYKEEDLKSLDLNKLIEMSKKTMALGKDYFGISLSGADPSVFFRYFYTALYQGNSNTVDPANPKVPTFNNEAGLKAIEQVMKLNEYTVTKGTGGRPPFVAGNVLFHFNGVWELSQLDNPEVKAKLDWGVVQFPQLFSSKKGVWSEIGVGVMTKAAADENTKLASIEFLKFMQDNGLSMAKAGHIPAKISLLNSEEFKKMPYSFFKDNMDVFAIPPTGPANDPINKKAVAAFMQLYWKEATDVKKMLDDAAKQAKEIVDNQ
jgi:multiple sugar transport system substrate-binding protein